MTIDKDVVKERAAAFLKIPAADLRDEMVLSDLIADSFVIVELMIELQETCGVRLSHDDVSHVRTVGELASRIVMLSGRTSAEQLQGDTMAVAAEER